MLDDLSIHGTGRHSNLSSLEKNCSQILNKIPTLNKEFFEKINHDVVPQKTDFFGYQMNTRRLMGKLYQRYFLSICFFFDSWYAIQMDTFRVSLV